MNLSLFQQPKKSSSEFASEMAKTLDHFEKAASKMPGPDSKLAKEVISKYKAIIVQNAVPAAETDLSKEVDSGMTFSR